MKKKEQELLENLLKGTSLIGIPLIYFFSFLKIFFYYKYYHIDISKYIDLTELITLFLADVALMLMLAAIVFVLLKHFKSVGKRVNLFWRCATLSLIPVYITYHWSFDGDISIESFALAFISVLLLMFLLHQLFEYFSSNKVSLVLRFISVYFLIFLICQVAGVGLMIQSNEEYAKHINFEARTIDNTILISDSCNYYIGSTKAFIFIHNEDENSSDVIPTSSLIFFRHGKDTRPRNVRGQGPSDRDPD